MVTVISSVEGVMHEPLAEIVYLKVYVPVTRPDAIAELDEVVVMVATLGVVPICTHVPVLPSFPLKLAELAKHKFWSDPALAAGVTSIETSSKSGVQNEPPKLVQRKT
jgi:hypothetical protein